MIASMSKEDYHVGYQSMSLQQRVDVEVIGQPKLREILIDAIKCGFAILEKAFPGLITIQAKDSISRELVGTQTIAETENLILTYACSPFNPNSRILPEITLDLSVKNPNESDILQVCLQKIVGFIYGRNTSQRLESRSTHRSGCRSTVTISYPVKRFGNNF